MTEGEVEAVAAELAKAGGVSWHSGQERGPLKLVMDRYRDRARLAIAALDRVRPLSRVSLAIPSALSSLGQSHKPPWSQSQALLSQRGAWSCTVHQETREPIYVALRSSMEAALTLSLRSQPAPAGWILKTSPLQQSSKVSQPW